jgi:microcystin-dependent protein
MANPFLGQISMFGGNFAPLGYALCNGQLLSIAQNDALFALIGTIYGGDGETTFALPNMQSRVPYHRGNLAGGSSYVIGENAGVETVTLTTNQLPPHTHTPAGNSTDGSQSSPANGFWGTASANIYSTTAPNAPMNAAAVGPAGGGQPHDNMLPFLCVNFIIALQGIFPPRN